jgi:hypothetical protein
LHLSDSLSERLENALEDSSHFLIVLSEASAKSEWVQFELERALRHKNSNLLQKIIPVKYKNCEVPSSLADLLYADLSKEIREVLGDRIQFTTSGYAAFLQRLCNAIRNSERKLTIQDKHELKTEIKNEPVKSDTQASTGFVRATYLVLGYRTVDAREKYVKNVIDNTNQKNVKNEIRPILLPPLLKFVFPDLKIGEKLFFSKNFFGNEFGHFAGFRKDDLAITLDYNVRKGIIAKKGNRYNVEIDIKERRITFLSK